MDYVNAYGPTPYTNTALYSDGGHDPGGSIFLGTNVLGISAIATLGYEQTTPAKQRSHSPSGP
ncbi:MAG TPA: hypothetical protein VFL42_01745, partial [Terriglobales bacterium]|nr:hypothetical protein [Terriglobales bacterium]